MIDCAMLSARSQSRQPARGGYQPSFFDEAAVKQVLKRAAEARQDVAEVSTALRIVRDDKNWTEGDAPKSRKAA